MISLGASGVVVLTQKIVSQDEILVLWLLISPKHELPALFLLRKLWAPLVISNRIRVTSVSQVMYSF